MAAGARASGSDSRLQLMERHLRALALFQRGQSLGFIPSLAQESANSTASTTTWFDTRA